MTAFSLIFCTLPEATLLSFSVRKLIKHLDFDALTVLPPNTVDCTSTCSPVHHGNGNAHPRTG